MASGGRVRRSGRRVSARHLPAGPEAGGDVADQLLGDQVRRRSPPAGPSARSGELEPEPSELDQAEGEQQVEGEPRADQVLLEGDEPVAEHDGDDLAREPQQQQEERRRPCRRGRSSEGGGGAGEGDEREEGPQEPRPPAEEPVPHVAEAPGRVVDRPAGMLGRPRVVAAGMGAQPRHLGLDPRGDAGQRVGIAGVEPEEAEAGQVGELGVDRVVAGDPAEDVAPRQVAEALRDPDRGEGLVRLGRDPGDPGEDRVVVVRPREARAAAEEEVPAGGGGDEEERERGAGEAAAGRRRGGEEGREGEREDGGEEEVLHLAPAPDEAERHQDRRPGEPAAARQAREAGRLRGPERQQGDRAGEGEEEGRVAVEAVPEEEVAGVGQDDESGDERRKRRAGADQRGDEEQPEREPQGPHLLERHRPRRRREGQVLGGPGEERGAREELAEIGGADRVRALHEESGPARRRLERLDAGGPGDAEEVPVVRHAAAGLAEEHGRGVGGQRDQQPEAGQPADASCWGGARHDRRWRE